MYDDEGYYVVLPDPDTLPEPYFDGLTWEQIKDEIERLEWQAEMQQQEEWFWQSHYSTGGDFF